VDVLPPNQTFPPVRTVESASTRSVTETAGRNVRGIRPETALLNGPIPRLLWVTPWRNNDGLLSLHFVNYDLDFKTGQATPAPPFLLDLRVPTDLRMDAASWLTPGRSPVPIHFERKGDVVHVAVPSVRVYGVLLLGPRTLDQVASRVLEGDAFLTRARMACDRQFGPLETEVAATLQARAKAATPGAAAKFARDARGLLHAVQARENTRYLDRIRSIADATGVLLALDFGGNGAKAPWTTVGPDTAYDARRGYGWLALEDDSIPTPEETYYALAEKYGAGLRGSAPVAGRLLFWPYRSTLPVPIQTNLACGTPRTLRVRVSGKQCRVRVITTNPSWTNRNFLVSGMVAANGVVRLLDTPMDRGAAVARDFTAPVVDGRLDLRFGGATGWAVCAVLVWPENTSAKATDARGAWTPVGDWRVSPRYANPDWYPIDQTHCPPEDRLAVLPLPGWRRRTAAATGIPVVDLGSNREANVGDVVLATAEVQSAGSQKLRLHFGASSSAMLWMNGEPIAYVPNEKGVRRDEFSALVRLRAGRNRIVVKLERFWERRWMFYAAFSK